MRYQLLLRRKPYPSQKVLGPIWLFAPPPLSPQIHSSLCTFLTVESYYGNDRFEVLIVL